MRKSKNFALIRLLAFKHYYIGVYIETINCGFFSFIPSFNELKNIYIYFSQVSNHFL